MLRQSSSKKDSHVVWDEENLKSNEEIQKQYSSVKIAEPKTPYRPPLLDAELDEEMRPLELDEKEQAQTAVMTAFDYVMRNGGADFTPPGPSHRRLVTASSADADAAAAAAAPVEPAGAAVAVEAAAVDGAVGDKRTEPSTSYNSSGSEGPLSADKKRRFEAMRKQHYNMKQALQQAKQLLSEDPEDEDGQGEEVLEGDEDDTADWKATNGSAAAESGNTHEEQQQQQQQQQHGAGAGNGQQQQDGSTEQQQQHDMEQTG